MNCTLVIYVYKRWPNDRYTYNAYASLYRTICIPMYILFYMKSTLHIVISLNIFFSYIHKTSILSYYHIQSWLGHKFLNLITALPVL